jgi:hypothetical protein
MHATGGPYFQPDLIGPNGKITRFHKGGSTELTTQSTAPSVQETTRTTATAGETARTDAKKRRGYQSTIQQAATLLGDSATQATGKTLLG